MNKIYIAGPYTASDRDGEDRNIHRAAEAGNEYANSGWDIYIPHLQFPYLVRNFQSELDYEQIMVRCINSLLHCDAIHMVSGWRKSQGAQLEYMVAKAKGITVLGEME